MVEQQHRPLRRLLVRLKDSPDHTESVDFSDVTLLAWQLESFELRRRAVRRRRPSDLHTFWNDRGETLSFSDDSYLGHEVVDLTAPALHGELSP